VLKTLLPDRGGTVHSAARALVTGSAPTIGGAPSDLSEETWDLLATLSPALLPYLDFKLRGDQFEAVIPQRARRALSSARQTAVVAGLRQRSVLKAALSSLAGRGC
jgi:hypothetical protein